MPAERGLYRNGKIELLEPLPSIPSADLLIEVVPRLSCKGSGHEPPDMVSTARLTESEIRSDEVRFAAGIDSTRVPVSASLRQIVMPDANGFIHIQVPSGFGRKVEVIMSPLLSEETESPDFECTDEKGIIYKMKSWTDEEFKWASIIGACGEDDTRPEDLFDV